MSYFNREVLVPPSQNYPPLGSMPTGAVAESANQPALSTILVMTRSLTDLFNSFQGSLDQLTPMIQVYGQMLVSAMSPHETSSRLEVSAGRYSWVETAPQLCFQSLSEDRVDSFIRKLVSLQPDLLKKQGPHGFSFLHDAVVASTRSEKQVPAKTVQLLVESNRDALVIQDEWGRTPIHLAFGMYGNHPMDLESIRVLVTGHPDVLGVRDNNSITPVMAAIASAPDKDGGWSHEMIALIVEMIRLRPEAVRGRHTGRMGDTYPTALEIACMRCRNPELIPYLIDADPAALCGTVFLREVESMEILEARKTAVLAVIEALFHPTTKGIVPRDLFKFVWSVLREDYLSDSELSGSSWEIVRAIKEKGDDDLRVLIERVLEDCDLELHMDVDAGLRIMVNSLYHMKKPERYGCALVGSVSMNNAPNEVPDGLLCVVCAEAKVNQVFLPCGHLCTCQGCARNLPVRGRGRATCPICRAAIESMHSVFFT
jgi:hypothetical protein